MTRRHQLAFDLGASKRLAMVVVDMQNFFIRAVTPYAPGITPTIRGLADAIRDAGGVVAWTRASWSDASPGAYPSWYATVMPPEILELTRRELRPGAPGHAIIPELEPQADDVVFDKYRFSAFVTAAIDFDDVLRSHGVDTLIVTGILTRFCCQSTARDAMMRDYRVLFPPDATADYTDEFRNRVLADLASMGLFDLRPAAELIAEVRAAARALSSRRPTCENQSPAPPTWSRNPRKVLPKRGLVENGGRGWD